MKTSRSLLIVAGALFILAAPAEARSRRGGSASPERGRIQAPSSGLQLASGLQMSGPINGSGPAPVAERLSEEDWRKVFVRKDPAK